MRWLAIDPGPEMSAFVEYDAGRLGEFGKVDNDKLLDILAVGLLAADALAIEEIRSYGRPVGVETFGTVRWSGRFEQRWLDSDGTPVVWVPRLDVRKHICHHGNATDPHVRQALIDRYGPGREKAIGTVKAKGPLHGVTGDVWQALGVAVTADETHGEARAA